MDTPVEQFEMWARVDLFGHTVRAGKLSVVNNGVEILYRLDIPTNGDGSGFVTKFYGKGAVYSIDPMSEEGTRVLAKKLNADAPISQWELPEAWQEGIRLAKAKQLVAPTAASTGAEGDDEDPDQDEDEEGQDDEQDF